LAIAALKAAASGRGNQLVGGIAQPASINTTRFTGCVQIVRQASGAIQQAHHISRWMVVLPVVDARMASIRINQAEQAALHVRLAHSRM
jgi:hypothetical protein